MLKSWELMEGKWRQLNGFNNKMENYTNSRFNSSKVWLNIPRSSTICNFKDFKSFPLKMQNLPPLHSKVLKFPISSDVINGSSLPFDLFGSRVNLPLLFKSTLSRVFTKEFVRTKQDVKERREKKRANSNDAIKRNEINSQCHLTDIKLNWTS